MATKVKWLIRVGDWMALLSHEGREIGFWQVEEVIEDGHPDHITIRLERGVEAR